MKLGRVVLLVFTVILLQSCGKRAFYQAGQSKLPITQQVLLLKEHCEEIGKGRLYFYRLNGRLILHNKRGYQALWLYPGKNRVTLRYIAKGKDYRYIYTSYEDILVNGLPGKRYRVRYKRTSFKSVKIWFEDAGTIATKTLPPSVCKQHNYRIPRDWIVY